MSELYGMVRAAIRPAAFVFMGLALAMVACVGLTSLFAFAGLEQRAMDSAAVLHMFQASAVAGILGGLAWHWSRSVAHEGLSRREAILSVNLIWIGAVFLGSLPYLFSGALGPVDALFESTSGFTTTGATVVADIEGTLPQTVLLWRSLTQWLGGMGIVVLFVAILPQVGIGGKHMFQMEMPGHDPKGFRPRVRETGVILWRLYLGFTLTEFAVLMVLGVSPFESLNHAFTTMATGGFSTRSASIGGFGNPVVEWAIIGFMILGGINFTLYFLALRDRDFSVFLHNAELRVYGVLLVLITAVVTVSTLGLYPQQPFTALRHAAFMVVSLLTSTGYGVGDYSQWPAICLGLVVLMMVMGGCSGSTSGGLKIGRVMILTVTNWVVVQRHARPKRVHQARIDNVVVNERTTDQAAAVGLAFVLTLFISTVLFAALSGAPMETSFGAMLSTTANMGPAPFHIGADNFASYPAAAKSVGIIGMVLGRLEFLTVLALFTRAMWR